jgi:glycosyltransferase involved in cell wall biosynthesis
LLKSLEWEWHLPIVESYLSFKGVNVYDCIRPPSHGYRCLVVRGADATQITRPEWHTPESMKVWENITKPGLLKAQRIIAYCRHQQQDLVRELHIPEERVPITYLGIDHQVFRPVADRNLLDGIRSRFHLAERFLLMVGPFDVVVNFDAVLSALALWKKAGEVIPVVAVGTIDDYTRGLQKKSAEAGLASHFLWTGHLKHSELALVMNLASGLVYPSLLPGIEMPPLEAMACGLPVVTSLEEVIADAGILIDPSSPEELYRAMRTIWESPARCADLARRGITRAAQFTWERMARETLAVYRNALGAR